MLADPTVRHGRPGGRPQVAWRSISPTIAYTGLTEFFVRSPSGAVAGHEAAGGADVARSARYLVSVIEGLRWPLLFGVYTEQEARAVLDAALDQILPGA